MSVVKSFAVMSN